MAGSLCGVTSTTTDKTAPIGVLCALGGELGTLAASATSERRVQGLALLELELGGVPILATVSGVGKVAAARAATVLLAQGARGLLVVGTCGGLVRGLVAGDLVHCTTAFQTDLAVREGRAVESDPAWRGVWRGLIPGHEGWFLTADRPVITPWRRLRLARAFAGPCVAEMETAAVGVVARAAGRPWAALRVVTDGAGLLTARHFRQNFSALAGRPADSLASVVPALP
jgi:adenosylhomocysteine nucleosidase